MAKHLAMCLVMQSITKAA